MLLTATTDWIQATAALIAVPGAITAFVLLFKRDKARETEISSLVSMSEQLTKMLGVSENRYRDSKKPHIETVLEYEQNGNILRLKFKNTNPQTSVRSYRSNVQNEQITKFGIANSGTEQHFHIEFRNVLPKTKVLWVDYATEENLVFIQEIFIWHENGHFVHSPGPIIYEKNSPLYESPTP